MGQHTNCACVRLGQVWPMTGLDSTRAGLLCGITTDLLCCVVNTRHPSDSKVEALAQHALAPDDRTEGALATTSKLDTTV